jgi:hypothetical protein
VILDRALSDPPLRALPVAVSDLLRAHRAPPPRGAPQLADWLAGLEFSFDRAAVLFGAATHDIGKIVHVAELSGPGSRHEAEGQQLLLAAGVEPRLARFAATHASWHPGIETEDLLVSLADKVWKAKRVDVVPRPPDLPDEHLVPRVFHYLTGPPLPAATRDEIALGAGSTADGRNASRYAATASSTRGGGGSGPRRATCRSAN